MIDLRLPHNGIAGHHGVQIALEHALHVLGVGAHPPQVGRRFEGTAAGAVGEILGIQHDTRQQRLRFAPQHVSGLHQILHQLRDQLAGRAGVGLVIVQCHLVNIAAAPAVMVDDRHPGTAFQQRLRLHTVRPVGIHHHQQRIRLGVEEGRVAGDEYACVFRLLLQGAQHRMGGVVLHVDDDLRLFAQLTADAADAGRRTQ